MALNLPRAATAIRILQACICFSFPVLCLQTAALEAQPVSEKQKIEALLKSVEGLGDAKFIRNDKEYDAASAVAFLRGKWSMEGERIKTAKDFIEKCATVSSTSGKPYLIRFKDGKEVKCAEYLSAELEKLNAPAGGKRDP